MIPCLSHLDIPDENIFRIKGEDDPADEANRYEEAIKSVLPLVNGLPQFDIVLLGMGDDGHTASIFPKDLQLLSSNKLVEKAIHPDNGLSRVTITGKLINNAAHVFFLVTGKTKQPVVKSIFNKQGDYLKYPAAHIKPLSKQLTWFLDKEAAGNTDFSQYKTC
ncbi:MAG: 6-phosphogluconolactonase [Bacteroidales bacterium]|nr:6-phosphogluconolactonase [Bacteroidales bacterium]